MKSQNKTQTLISVVLALIVIGVVVYFVVEKSNQPGEYDTLAQCLSENGVVMYGAWWCPHCKAQKEDFGKSFEYINYVECSPGSPGSGQTQECDDEGVKSYPTWKFPDGTVFEGEQILQKQHNAVFKKNNFYSCNFRHIDCRLFFV
jgi:hypothetical protein